MRHRILRIRSCPSSRSTFARSDEPRRKRCFGLCENGPTVPPVRCQRVLLLSIDDLFLGISFGSCPAARAVQDLVASLAAGGPSQTVPQVRINECLLALARAKVVVKAVVKVRADPAFSL